jgi:signal-transduction protein with cAMP-binding, CBS, and nucleotidyltransferase domain
MFCEELCYRPLVSCAPFDNAVDAARAMALENIGCLVVCTDDDHLLGVLTDRDLALRVVAAGLRPASTSVEEVMTRNPVTCRPSDDLAAAELLMAQHQIERLPIVDDDGRCWGVVSLADIASSEREKETGRVLRQITEREARLPH